MDLKHPELNILLKEFTEVTCDGSESFEQTWHDLRISEPTDTLLEDTYAVFYIIEVSECPWRWVKGHFSLHCIILYGSGILFGGSYFTNWSEATCHVICGPPN